MLRLLGSRNRLSADPSDVTTLTIIRDHCEYESRRASSQRHSSGRPRFRLEVIAFSATTSSAAVLEALSAADWSGFPAIEPTPFRPPIGCICKIAGVSGSTPAMGGRAPPCLRRRRGHRPRPGQRYRQRATSR
jgi:hypothetical protein